MANIQVKSKPGRLVRKRRARPRFLGDSDEGGNDDDLSDFIVGDNEDMSSDGRSAERSRSRAGKGKARAIVLSDDEADDAGIIYGAKPDDGAPSSEDTVKMMPKFLPSTKMKVRHVTTSV